MAAYLRLERELCPRCGTSEGDWVDPVTRKYLDPPKWEAETRRCWGCAEMEAVEKTVPRGERGVRIVLVPWRDTPFDEDD